MTRQPSPQRDRRGNAAVTIAATIPMMGFLALVVDVGLLQATQSQLQAGVDAGALAGAGYLDGTSAGMTKARKMVAYVASQNTVNGKPLMLADREILLGYYKDSQFVESTDPQKALAVYVEKDVRDIATSFAATAFGDKFMDTSAHVIANRSDSGVSKSDCFLPIAIPDCYFHGDDTLAFSARMTSSMNDNAGWSDLYAQPSAASVNAQLMGQCGGGIAGAGSVVYLNNGQIASVVHTVDDLLEASTKPWNTTKLGPIPARHAGSSVGRYGYVVEGPVIIFHPAGGTCGSATQFNQSAPIVGFAWATLYDAREQGTDKTIWMYVDPKYGSSGGLEGGGFRANYTFSAVGLVY